MLSMTLKYQKRGYYKQKKKYNAIMLSREDQPNKWPRVCLCIDWSITRDIHGHITACI